MTDYMYVCMYLMNAHMNVSWNSVEFKNCKNINILYKIIYVKLKMADTQTIFHIISGYTTHKNEKIFTDRKCTKFMIVVAYGDGKEKDNRIWGLDFKGTSTSSEICIYSL